MSLHQRIKEKEHSIIEWETELLQFINILHSVSNNKERKEYARQRDFVKVKLEKNKAELLQLYRDAYNHPSNQIHDAGHIYEPSALNISAGTILESAFKHMQDRAQTYDNPEGERSIPLVMQLFNMIRGRDLTAEEGWLIMVLLKIVRANQGEFKLDSFEDLAAYAALYGEEAANAKNN